MAIINITREKACVLLLFVRHSRCRLRHSAACTYIGKFTPAMLQRSDTHVT